MLPDLKIIQGDCLEMLRTLPDESVHCTICSPPYWGLRRYIEDGAPEKEYEIGLENTPEEYVAKMVEVFREVRRVLRSDGTCWINLGSSYAQSGMGGNPDESPYRKQATNSGSLIEGRKPPEGFKPKDMIPIPWMVAMALQADGWWLRQDIIWAKPNPMPESVTDRCTKSHEYIFLLSKSARYFWDAEAIKEPASELTNCPPTPSDGPKTRMNIERRDEVSGHGWADAKVPYRPAFRNKRSVWTVPSYALKEQHFASYPPDLIKPCILAGTSARGCCPKCGAPWERVLERNETQDNETILTGKSISNVPGLASGTSKDRVRRLNGKDYQHVRGGTLDWIPTCKCHAAEMDIGDGFPPVKFGHPHPIPCTVLDVFAGSFTTCAVALELGRSAIGIELNPSYVEMGRKRCAVTPGLALA